MRDWKEQGRRGGQSQGALGVLHAYCQWPFLNGQKRPRQQWTKAFRYLVELHGGRRPRLGWNDGRSREVRIKAHIGASVNLCSLNRVCARKEGRRGPRSTGRLRRLNGCWGRPKGFGSRSREAECCQQELGSWRDLICAVTAIAGVLNPLGTRLEGGVHVNEEACIGTATKLRVADRSPRIHGLNFEQGGRAESMGKSCHGTTVPGIRRSFHPCSIRLSTKSGESSTDTGGSHHAMACAIRTFAM